MKLHGWKTAAGIIGLAIVKGLGQLVPELQPTCSVLEPWLWALTGLGAADKIRRGQA